jgi:predicted amidophosphoribosyltransferase
MTQALENVFSHLSSLPADEQDRIAAWLQSQLVSEEGWTRRFDQSQDLLSALADEALADLAAGRTTDLDPDKM